MGCTNNIGGVIFRNASKYRLKMSPPLPGEMVFALDTGEHGWLGKDGKLVWKDLSIDIEEGSGYLFSICESPKVFTESSNWESM